MRKTRLLLDAVLAAGRRDVTFCALDLCQQSLSDALQALQGEIMTHHAIVASVQSLEAAQNVEGEGVQLQLSCGSFMAGGISG
jgi:uncharacterized SAM-dependent methyltransferase